MGKLFSHAVGLLGEHLVICLLRLKLYRILVHRYRSSVGEIDIIATKDNSLVCIEVKTSVTSSFTEIPLTVTQRKRIVAAAKHFLSHKNKFAHYQVSFEVYCVSPKVGILRIPNAWQDND